MKRSSKNILILLKNHSCEILFSLLLSTMLIIGRHVRFSGNVGSPLSDTCTLPFSFGQCFADILMICILTLLFSVLLDFYVRVWFPVISHVLLRNPSVQTSSTSDKKLFSSDIVLFFFFFLVIGFLWLPYLLTFYPGSVLGDSLASINPMGRFSNHHPVFYTIFVQTCLSLGFSVFGNMNGGVFTYTLIQFFIMDACLSGLLLWLYKRGLRLWYLVLSALFFGLFPAFPSYAIIMWKDPLFSCALILLGFSIFRTGSRYAPWLIFCAALLTCFLRNNGLFICVLFAAAALLFYRKKRLLIPLLSAILLSFLIQGPLYNTWRISKAKAEAFGIPMQQIAYTVMTDPSTDVSSSYPALSESELTEINVLLPVNLIRSAYSPCIVDTLKFDADFDREYFIAHTEDFLLLWAKLLPKHFPQYIHAYLLETLGFWHPTLQNSYGYIDQYIIENNFGIRGKDLFLSVFGFSLYDKLQAFRPMIGSGSLFWICFLSLTLCLAKKKYHLIWLLLPQLFCWCSVMISTPVAFSLRYVFVLMMMLPINIVLPFLPNSEIQS